jgi:hypothetical protein
VYSFDTVRLLVSALIPRSVHLHGLATAGAMLTCVAIVLNVGPFTAAPNKAANIDGSPGAAGRQASATTQERVGSRSIPRWDIDALIHPPQLRSAAEPEDFAERVSTLIWPSPFVALGDAQAVSWPAPSKDADDSKAARAWPADPVAPQPEPASVDLARDAVVGVWAPDGSCSARDFRDGLLPTVINAEGAWAGETFCQFTNRKQTEAGWTVVAKCSNGRDRWTSNVRLTVSENRLTWTSRRGTQTYTRCPPDVAMAQAR